MEGYRYDYEYLGEDLVVLAGDIHTKMRHREIIEQIPTTVKIVMVPGNHEYYGSEFKDVNDFLIKLQVEYSNFWVLLNQPVNIDGVWFYGGTMFTDLNLYNDPWMAMHYIKNSINDFHVITKYDEPKLRKWNTVDHIEEHSKFTKGLQAFIRNTEGEEKRVVVSHFVPTPKHIHSKYNLSLINPYFTCDMEQYMGWEGLWLHGHTHDSFDSMVGDTRVVCNPRGYGHENINGFKYDLILEI